MTNSIAIILALILIAAIGTDVVKYESGNTIFLSKKMLELIEWLAFWR